jgi:hypothetical protein
MLANSAPLQGFQPIGRWNAQIVEPLSGIEGFQFAPRNLEYLNREALGALTIKHRLGDLVLEAPDQIPAPAASNKIVSITDTKVNRLVSVRDAKLDLGRERSEEGRRKSRG